MNLRVTVVGEAKDFQVRSRSESESEQGDLESAAVDAKPSDLPLGRLKVG